MVTGGPEPKPTHGFCATERAGYCPEDCGPNAKHFEPKDAPVVLDQPDKQEVK